MKQPAVEWLIDQLIPKDQHEGIMDIIQEAKEMEKQHIVDAYETAMETDIYNEPLKVGKQYYSETFNKD